MLRLLLDLRDRLGLAILLVTHNLGVVAQTCDSLAVMYAGRVMERGAKRELLRAPAHPYTEALLKCQPGARQAGGAAAGHSRPAAVAERLSRRLPLPSALSTRRGDCAGQRQPCAAVAGQRAHRRLPFRRPVMRAAS